MKVRPLTIEDMPEVTLLGYEMHQESPNYQNLGYSPQKCLKLLDTIKENPNEFCGFVAESESRIVGIFLGAMCEMYFSEDLVASDILIYVIPEKRGSFALFRLVRAFEDWADNLGAVEKTLAVSSGVHPEKTLSAFLRLGYTPSAHQVSKRTLPHVVQETKEGASRRDCSASAAASGC